MKNAARVLVVDDEEFVRESLMELLSAQGFEALGASGADEAVELLRVEEIDVVLTDMKMPAGDGNALLRAARAEGLDVPVVVLSGASTVGEAVTAMKAGAYDLLEKPADPQLLQRALERALERARLRRELIGLRATLRLPKQGRRWVATCAASKRVLAASKRVAACSAPVLLSGPAGAGKEVVAEQIHRASDRARQPFVRVDCALLSARDVSAVLFGERKGARTAERVGRISLARGGSLFLDEIGALPLEAQARLSALLESGEYTRIGDERARRVDVRVIATTKQHLRERAEAGTFRDDLFWRLDVLRIEVPSLDLRREDVSQLIAELGRDLRTGPERDGAALEIGADALALLQVYSWPGNVRELRTVLERVLLLRSGAAGGPIDAETVAAALDSSLGGAPDLSADSVAAFRLRPNLLALERRLVLDAIKKARGRRSEAADLLGVDSRNLGYYFRKHKITAEELDHAAKG